MGMVALGQVGDKVLSLKHQEHACCVTSWSHC